MSKRSSPDSDGVPMKDLSDYSPLQLSRLEYKPVVPPALADSVTVSKGELTTATSPEDGVTLSKFLPTTFQLPMLNLKSAESGSGSGSGGSSSSSPAPPRVGVVFCGRQTPGGHNVIWGMLDHIQKANPSGQVIGFLNGTVGFFEGRHIVVTPDVLAAYKNQGGFDLLGRSVDQIRTEAHRASALSTCDSLGLTGLVLIGGNYTATDAAYLTEYLNAHQTGSVRTSVVTVPGAIDGDLKNEFIETTFGFDTACKVYAQLVGNMATDGASAAKYYYFVRLMGRAASHIGLEVALQTQPNVVLLGEEMVANKVTLNALINSLADTVVERREAGKNFGMVLVPEGLIVHIPELVALIEEMNTLFATGLSADDVAAKLTPWSRALLEYLPPLIRDQMFTERESHGTVQLSQISTERLISTLLAQELDKRKAAGTYPGGFAPITHFFGYQARCSLPSNFDCNLSFSLGAAAAAIALSGNSGYAAVVRNLEAHPSEWKVYGVPLSAMMECDHGTRGADSSAPAIPAVLVDVHSGAFREYQSQAAKWRSEDAYVNPGPIQFRGLTADRCPISLTKDRTDYLERIAELTCHMESIKETCKPGVSETLLDVALASLGALTSSIETVSRHR